MRNPKSSSAPLITGPGGDYRREHWPLTWCNAETFSACAAMFLVLIVLAFDRTFGFGLIVGLCSIVLFRRAA